MIHCVGEILIDQFNDNGKVEKFPGGAPFNVASNIKKFGGNVSFYGSLGKDSNGNFLKDIAKSMNFKQLVINYPVGKDTTIALVTLKNGERSFKFIRDNGADYQMSFAKFKKLKIAKGDIVHIGSLMLNSKKGLTFANKVIDYAKQVGAYISFDINYRDDIFSSPIKAKHAYMSIASRSDIVKVSSDELNILSKYKSFKNQVKELFNSNQMVFISQGDAGSSFFYKGKLISSKSISVKQIDTTGAGDAFYSFVLYSLDGNLKNVSDGTFIKNVLFKSNIVGALSTLKKGAINVVPSLNELDEYLLLLKNPPLF